MLRRLWMLLGVGFVAVGITVAFAGGEDVGKASELAAEVKALRKQVAALEKRLEVLEGRPNLTFAPEALSPLPPEGPGTQNFPPGTQRREFNGMTYYMMPIAEARAQGAAMAVARPAKDR